MSVVARIIMRGEVTQEVDLADGPIRVDADGKVYRIPESPAPEVEVRLLCLERQVQRLIEDSPADAVRAGTAVSLARARRLNAEAEKLEREIRAEYGASADAGDNPVVIDKWRVDGSPTFGLVGVLLTTAAGRTFTLTDASTKVRALALAMLNACAAAERQGGGA